MKSKYSFRTYKTSTGKFVLSITDLNGSMSITNNIENVLAEIVQKQSLNLNKAIIIYRDSTGKWDGWSYNDDDFVILQETSEERAVIEYQKQVTV